MAAKSVLALCAGISAARSNTEPSFAIALLDRGWSSTQTFLDSGARGPPGHEAVTRTFQHVLQRDHSRKSLDSCWVIDVGMNVGFYTLQSAGLGCTVDAFEIQPRMHELIDLSRLLNPAELSRRIHPHHVAIANETRSMYVIDADRAGLSIGSSVISSRSHPKRKSDQVVTARLDDFVKQQQQAVPSSSIALLKVDVEGYAPSLMHDTPHMHGNYMSFERPLHTTAHAKFVPCPTFAPRVRMSTHTSLPPSFFVCRCAQFRARSPLLSQQPHPQSCHSQHRRRDGACTAVEECRSLSGRRARATRAVGL